MASGNLRWPVFAELDRRLYSSHDIQVLDVVRAMPPGFLYGVGPNSPVPPGDTQEIGLTVAGIAACPDTSETLSVFVEFIQMATGTEKAWTPPTDDPARMPTVTDADFVARARTLPVAGREHLLRLLFLIIKTEGSGWAGLSANSETGQWTVSLSRQVRSFANVRDIGDYWSRRYKPWESGQPGSPPGTPAASAPAPPVGSGYRSRETNGPSAASPTGTVEGRPAGTDRGTVRVPRAARGGDGLTGRFAGASGVQVGSGNVQHNHFYGNPAGADSIGTRLTPISGGAAHEARATAGREDASLQSGEDGRLSGFLRANSSQSPQRAVKRMRLRQARMAYVIDYDGSLHQGEYDGKLTPVDLASGRVGVPIALGSQPVALALSHGGRIAYVADRGGTVTPVDLASGTPDWPIPVGPGPHGISISPDGATACVLRYGRVCELTPVDLTTGRVGTSIAFGQADTDISMASNGDNACVLTCNRGDVALTPVNLAALRPGHSIPVPVIYSGIVAICPDGTAAYVAGEDAKGRGWVIPVNLLTHTPGTPIKIGSRPVAIEIDPQGVTAYVVTFFESTITPINLASRALGTPISLGIDHRVPRAFIITADGTTAYVAGFEGVITPVDLSTGKLKRPIQIPGRPFAIAIAP